MPTLLAQLTNGLARRGLLDGRVDYARKAAPGQKGLWDEDAHPRGQPENAGEFVKKGEQTHAPQTPADAHGGLRTGGQRENAPQGQTPAPSQQEASPETIREGLGFNPESIFPVAEYRSGKEKRTAPLKKRPYTFHATWKPNQNGTLFHGCRTPIDKLGKKPIYLTDDANEAAGYAAGQHLGGRGDQPMIYPMLVRAGKTLNVDAAISEMQMDGFDEEEDFQRLFDTAKRMGARFVTYEHPSNHYDDREQRVVVSLYPDEDIELTDPKILGNQRYSLVDALRDAWQVTRYKVGSGTFASHFGHLMQNWEETKHPRGGKGTEKGGQFVSKGQQGSGSPVQENDRPGTAPSPPPNRPRGNRNRPETLIEPTPEQIAEKPAKLYRDVKIGKSAYHLQKRANGWYAQPGGKGQWRRVAEHDQGRVDQKIQGQENQARIIDLLYSQDMTGQRLEKESGLDKDTFINTVISLMKIGRISQNAQTGRLGLGQRQRQLSFKERKERPPKPAKTPGTPKPPSQGKPRGEKPFRMPEVANPIERSGNPPAPAQQKKPALPTQQPKVVRRELSPEQQEMKRLMERRMQIAKQVKMKGKNKPQPPTDPEGAKIWQEEREKIDRKRNEARESTEQIKRDNMEKILGEYKEEHGLDLDPKLLVAEAEEMFKPVQARFLEREGVKKRLRDMVGHAGKINKAENQNRDYADFMVHGQQIRELAREYPHYFGTKEEDWQRRAWNLAKEGKIDWGESSPGRPPTPFDERILRSAAEKLRVEMSDTHKGPTETASDWGDVIEPERDPGLDDEAPEPVSKEELEAVPFSMAGLAEMFRVCYARKAAPGQKSLWDEEKHPRDKTGEFTEKGKGENVHPKVEAIIERLKSGKLNRAKAGKEAQKAGVLTEYQEALRKLDFDRLTTDENNQTQEQQIKALVEKVLANTISRKAGNELAKSQGEEFFKQYLTLKSAEEKRREEARNQSAPTAEERKAAAESRAAHGRAIARELKAEQPPELHRWIDEAAETMDDEESKQAVLERAQEYFSEAKADAKREQEEKEREAEEMRIYEIKQTAFSEAQQSITEHLETKGWTYEFHKAGGGSLYIEATKEVGDLPASVKIRIADHYAPEGAGFDENTQEYHSEPDVNYVFDPQDKHWWRYDQQMIQQKTVDLGLLDAAMMAAEQEARDLSKRLDSA